MYNIYKSYVSGVIGFPEDSITISIPLYPRPSGSIPDRPGDQSGVGSVELTGGGAGSVDSITVDGVELLSGPVAFNSDLDTTATDVATDITATDTTPNYTATANGAVINIFNDEVKFGEVVVSMATIITTSDTNISTTGDGSEDSVPDSEVVIDVAYTLGLDPISSIEKSTIEDELKALFGVGVVRFLNDGSPGTYRG